MPPSHGASPLYETGVSPKMMNAIAMAINSAQTKISRARPAAFSHLL